ncbi:hypothetical protein DSECCO2_623440 [anaerobic digester metagenome]
MDAVKVGVGALKVRIGLKVGMNEVALNGSWLGCFIKIRYLHIPEPVIVEFISKEFCATAGCDVTICLSLIDYLAILIQVVRILQNNLLSIF